VVAALADEVAVAVGGGADQVVLGVVREALLQMLADVLGDQIAPGIVVVALVLPGAQAVVLDVAAEGVALGLDEVGGGVVGEVLARGQVRGAAPEQAACRRRSGCRRAACRAGRPARPRRRSGSGGGWGCRGAR
jgi:hypothetical protein